MILGTSNNGFAVLETFKVAGWGFGDLEVTWVVRFELTSTLFEVCRIVTGTVARMSSPGNGKAVFGNAGDRCWGDAYGCGENLDVLP